MADDIIRIRRDNLTNWTSQNPTLALGEISYNTTDKEIRVGDNSTSWLNLPPIKAFVDSTYKTVYNNSGGPISKGEVVYITGSHSQTALTVAKADASDEATAATTIGVALDTISNSAYGKIVLRGFITGLNTSGLSGSEGSSIWLSETAGGITSTKPTSPAHKVLVGFLVKKDSTTGIIYVNVVNGQELDELHDVKIIGLANNNMLQYKTASGTWENVTTTLGTDSLWAAKGDLVVGTADNQASILTVGTDGYVLTADATTATGLKWAASTGGSGGGGAPTDATYITKTSNGTLTAEFALSGLSTGIVKVTTGTGDLSSFSPASGVETFLTTPSSANLASAVTDETGTGALVFANTPTLVTPILGTPTSGNLSNCTALPLGSITGLGANVSTFLATPSSANLAAAITNETGTGNLVFATSPTLVTPTLGAATATSINKVAITAPATSSTLTIADGKTLTASNTLTFTGTDSSSVAFGTGGTVLYNGGALGTPSSGTLTNCTGLPIASLSGLTTNGDLLYHDGTSVVRLARGTDGQVLKATSTSIAWGTDNTGGGGGSPGGANTEIQFNESGSFGGDPELTWNTSNKLLTVDGNIQLSDQGNLRFADADSSNYVAFQAPATITSNVTWTLPATDGSADQVLKTNGSGTLGWVTAGSGSGTKTYAVYTPLDNQPPASSFATLDTTSDIAILNFDDAATKEAIFLGIVPEGAAPSTSGGIKVYIHWSANSTSTNNVVWTAAFERQGVAAGFATAQTATSAHNGTANISNIATITLTTSQIDSITGGDSYRLKITRDGTNGSDSLTATAYVTAVEVRSGA